MPSKDCHGGTVPTNLNLSGNLSENSDIRRRGKILKIVKKIVKPSSSLKPSSSSKKRKPEDSLHSSKKPYNKGRLHRCDQSSKLKLKNTLIVDHFEILGRGKSRSTSKGEGPRIPLDGTAETSLGLYSMTGGLRNQPMERGFESTDSGGNNWERRKMVR